MTDVLEPTTSEPPSPWRIGTRHRARRWRLLAATGIAFALLSAVFGPPTGREVVTAWLLLLLYAVVGGDGAAWRRAVVHDWLPLLLVLFAYDSLRGFVKDLTGHAHVLPQLRVDAFLFGGTVPTVWLQQHLYQPSPSWYDYAIVPVYLSHFIAPTAVAAGLWATSYPRFRRFVWSFVLLTAATIVTYAVFPAEPPWLARQTNPQAIGPVVRVISHTLLVGGIPTVHSAIERGEAYANPVAAVPSLHAAVPLLILLLSWPYCRRLGRLLLGCYVGGMAFTLVYGGEHYVSDVLLGWAYAGAAVAAVSAALPRLERRRQRRTTPSLPVGTTVAP